MEEKVILVDTEDNEIGTEEKMKAHIDNKLHRAISIFIFNDKRKLMLQKRNKNKYHSGGLWTNTTCSHPRPDETAIDAAHRRLKEEMGITTELKKIFTFIYHAEFDNGLHEHEFDHSFIGRYNDEPNLNREEAEDWKWISLEDLQKEIEKSPEKYTEWLKIAVPKLQNHLDSL